MVFGISGATATPRTACLRSAARGGIGSTDILLRDDLESHLFETHDVVAAAPDLDDPAACDAEDEHERPRQLGTRGGQAAIRTRLRVAGGSPKGPTGGPCGSRLAPGAAR